MGGGGAWSRAAPLAAWMLVIAVLSGPLGSEESMRAALSRLLGPLTSLWGAGPPGEALPWWAVWALRKSLHLAEYAILALLGARWFSSLRGVSFDGAVGGSLALSVVWAGGDELHQVFVPGRTGAVADLVIDLLGAALMLAAVSGVRAEGRDLGRRLLDVAGASVGLAVSAPLLIIAAAAIRLHMGPPVFFTQTRIGRGERPFTVLKLRTMGPPLDAQGRRLKPSERVTPTGRVLRALSIDEFPQFWNVLRGDMSLVGPRPLYVEYLPYYTEREKARHLVRPGLTGLAQISGRNTTPWDRRLALDVQYVEARGVGLDLRLLGRTVGKVLRRSGVRDTTVEGLLSEHRERGKSRTGTPVRD